MIKFYKLYHDPETLKVIRVYRGSKIKIQLPYKDYDSVKNIVTTDFRIYFNEVAYNNLGDEFIEWNLFKPLIYKIDSFLISFKLYLKKLKKDKEKRVAHRKHEELMIPFRKLYK